MRKIRISIHKEVINLLSKQIDNYYDKDTLYIDMDSIGTTEWSNSYNDYDVYYLQEHYLILLGWRIGNIEAAVQRQKLKRNM